MRRERESTAVSSPQRTSDKAGKAILLSAGAPRFRPVRDVVGMKGGATRELPLRGREPILDHIRAALEQGAVLRGSTVVLRGEIGSGRSAVLDWASRTGERAQFAVLRIKGNRRLTRQSFAAMSVPVLSFLDRHIPLSGAPRLFEGMTEKEVEAALWRSLAATARRRRLLVIVDDCQWLDPASLRLLTALANHLTQTGLVCIAATGLEQVGSAAVRHSTELQLTPLDDDAARAVLSDRYSGWAPVVRSTVVTAAEGNALALVDLASALTAAQRSGNAPLPDPLRTGPALGARFGQRFRELPSSTRAVLALLAYTDEATKAADFLSMAELLGQDVDALAAAEMAGLVTGDRMPVFTKRIYRHLAHWTAAEKLRQQAYAAWASLAVPETGPVPAADERRETELEAAAQAATRSGNWKAAVRLLYRAAEVSHRPDDRSRLLVLAATACAHAGWPQLALTFTRGSGDHADPVVRNTANLVRAGSILDTSDDPSEAAPLLSRALASEPVLDSRLRAWNVFRLASLSTSARSAQWARAAIRSLSAAVEPAHPLRLAVMASENPTETADELRAHITSAADAALNSLRTDPYVLTWLADAAWRVDETDLSSELLAAALRGKEATQGAHLLHCWELQTAVMVAQGRWTELHDLTEERVRLLRARGLERGAVALLSQVMLVRVRRGEQRESRALIREVRHWAERHSSASSLRLAAYAEQLLVSDNDVTGTPSRTPWYADADPRRDAIARLAHVDIIQDALLREDVSFARRYHEGAARAGLTDFSRDMATLMLHGRALLAAHCGEEATGSRFDQAVAAAASSSRPFDRARVALDYGTWLHRQRRSAEARVHLRLAFETFTWLRAEPWRDLTRAGLRASGAQLSRGRHRTAAVSTPLTAYEQRIAQLAASGMTNREIGRTLNISPRTVASHLYRIFPRLGITSRREIAGVLAVTGSEPQVAERSSS